MGRRRLIPKFRMNTGTRGEGGQTETFIDRTQGMINGRLGNSFRRAFEVLEEIGAGAKGTTAAIHCRRISFLQDHMGRGGRQTRRAGIEYPTHLQGKKNAQENRKYPLHGSIEEQKMLQHQIRPVSVQEGFFWIDLGHSRLYSGIGHVSATFKMGRLSCGMEGRS